MKTFSLSRLFLALAAGAALSACSSSVTPSDQEAPGSQSRPVLSASEAKNFTQQRYFSDMSPDAAPWSPSDITIPQSPDFVVGPENGEGITHTSIQAAVDAAMTKHSSRRQYIAIQPGEYEGTVYVPAGSGSLTLYGTGNSPADVKIGMALDSEIDANTWRHAVNPGGKYMPGKPAWYMFDNCQNRHEGNVGLMCSAVFWSQNSGLQLKNLTIQNTLGDAAGEGDHRAVALRSDGDKVQIDRVNILGRQNTFLVTNSDLRNRMMDNRLTRTLVTNSYIEGDVDMVAGRGAVVFDNTEFRLVNSRIQTHGWVFAPATLSDMYYGFLVKNSRLIADGEGVAQLGRAWDLDNKSNGQVVIRNSIINAGFNQDRPWGDATGSDSEYAGNVGDGIDDDGNIKRDLNAPSFNRLWEYQNRGESNE
ncbi:putative acyl-CoA thioester hydrolase [Erwinia sp. CPCC 100877]|nr:putative acyl-CoA thioester hydrolase [Erwinia sp. CPCC 100877]